jgi:hypothetical protein
MEKIAIRLAVGFRQEDLDRIERIKALLKPKMGAQGVSSIIRLALIALEERESK